MGQVSESSLAVRLSRVVAGYDGAVVLDSLSLEIPSGAFVGVVGPSGSGKTTLLRLLTGRCGHYRGEVEVCGQAVRRGRAPRRVGFVPQSGSVEWDFPLTVRQAVLLGATASSRRVPWFSRSERGHADDLLERLGLDGFGGRHIGTLSGGQRQRMFLARAMITDCSLVLLDEPTSGADMQTRREILTLLGELNAEGLTVVLTTHEINWVAAHLPRLVALAGTVVADGTPEEVLTTTVLRKVYGADMRVVHEAGTVQVMDPAPLLPRVERSLR